MKLVQLGTKKPKGVKACGPTYVFMSWRKLVIIRVLGVQVRKAIGLEKTRMVGKIVS